jgi:plastocyanin
MTRRLTAVLFLLLLVVPARTASAATVTVTIDTTLHPASLTVAPGTTVTWRNAGASRHRVRTTSAPVELDSGDLDRGQSWTFTLRTPGTYRYVDHRDEENSAYWGTVVVSSSAAAGPAQSAPTAASAATVRMAGRAFSPSSVRLGTGGTVTFTNDDGRSHTVTSDAGLFDSGVVASGSSYRRRFASAGTYRYHCAIHPDMTGTVVVPTSSGAVPAAVPARAAAPPVARALPPSRPGSARVTVVDFAFTPARLAVHVGDTVSWVNTGQAPHTVTASNGAFGTPLLAAGATYRTVARSAATVSYVCQFHPQMRGTLVVLPASAALPAPVAAVPAPATPAAASVAPPASQSTPAAPPAEARARGIRTVPTSMWDSPLVGWTLWAGLGLAAFLGVAWWRGREPGAA